MKKNKEEKNELEEITKDKKKEEFDLQEFICISKKVREIIEEENKEKKNSGEEYGRYLW